MFEPDGRRPGRVGSIRARN